MIGMWHATSGSDLKKARLVGWQTHDFRVPEDQDQRERVPIDVQAEIADAVSQIGSHTCPVSESVFLTAC